MLNFSCVMIMMLICVAIDEPVANRRHSLIQLIFFSIVTCSSCIDFFFVIHLQIVIVLCNWSARKIFFKTNKWQSVDAVKRFLNFLFCLGIYFSKFVCIILRCDCVIFPLCFYDLYSL